MQGQKAGQTKVEPTPAEKLFRRNSRLWLVGAGVAVVVYMLASGQYITVDLRQSLMGGDGDDDDDEESGRQ